MAFIDSMLLISLMLWTMAAGISTPKPKDPSPNIEPLLNLGNSNELGRSPDTEPPKTSIIDKLPLGGQENQKEPLLPSGAMEAEPRIPTFQEQPRDQYMVRNAPVRMSCVVESASSVYFKCNGGWIRPESTFYSEVETTDGKKARRLEVEVTRKEYDSFFATYTYWCQCVAYSGAGQVKSRKALVRLSFLRRNFEHEPTGGRVRVGNEYKLHCSAPNGQPKPEVVWMKDDVMIDPSRDQHYVITQDGDLIVRTQNVDDSGNYTCIARNAVTKRKSHTAHLQVVVDGGWSTWLPWSECGTSCGIGENTRLRTCTNPTPLNGGARCKGEALQSKKCNNLCPVDGGWTDWSDWATCSPECVHRRRRTCSKPIPQNSGRICPGSDIETRNCTTGHCIATAQDRMNQANSQNIALYSCLFVALGLLLLVVIATIVILKRRRTGSGRGSYSHGRNSRSFPQAASRNVQEDFCIIPTKLPLNQDEPYTYPPAYSSFEPKYQLRNHPQMPNSPDKPSDSYHRHCSCEEQPFMTSRDDGCAYLGAGKNTIRIGYALKQPSNHPRIDHLYKRPPSDEFTQLPHSPTGGQKHVTFNRRLKSPEYDSGFEGELAVNQMQDRPIENVEQEETEPRLPDVISSDHDLSPHDVREVKLMTQQMT